MRSPDSPYLNDNDWADLQAFRAASAQHLASAPNLLPRAERNRRLYEAALSREATEGLRAFADTIPVRNQLHDREEYGTRLRSELKRQCELAVLAFKAGVAVSADLYLGGFDTHDDTTSTTTGCSAT